jgi:hypothetical protein
VARAMNTTLDRLGSSSPRLNVTPPREFAARPEPFAARPEPFAPREPRPDPFAPRPEPRAELLHARPPAPAPVFAPPVQTDYEPPSVPEFESRATNARARAPEAPMPLLSDDRPLDTSELRATEVRGNDGRGPVVTSGPAAATLHVEPGRTDTEPTNMGPDFVESPSQVFTPITHKIPTPPPMPAPQGLSAVGSTSQKDPFDDQTAVASPTEALLRAAREVSQVAPNPAADSVEQEFRQVYRDFIETKQACGESTDGITFDKFSGKLRSNRQQLITRYACKTVKFQVYVKDGKAALKATPVTT